MTAQRQNAYFSFCLLLFAFLGVVATAAPTQAQLFIPGADVEKGDRLRETTPERVALLYYKFAGKTPDFKSWAKKDEAYLKASDYEKPLLLGQIAARYQQDFKLITPNEEMIAHFEAKLSEFNFEYEGYLVENFTLDMFIPFTYRGINIAVVPKDIVEKKFLPIPDLRTAKKIDDMRHKSPDKHTATLTFKLEPAYAEVTDNTRPFVIDGKSWVIMTANILEMAFYDDEGNTIWNNNKQADETIVTEERNELLDLYR